jgi:hypothetical protein
MPRRWSSVGVAAILLVSVRPPAALPWGCRGHRTIALIAEQHLTANARAQARSLLKKHPIDPRLSRFCKPQIRDPFVDASTWADDVRGDRASPWHTTGSWHFLDIPRGATRKETGGFCPAEGCVTRAIRDQVEVLRSHSAGSQQQADALRFILHLVGDVHQPLHCATNGDRGGNCVPITYFGQAPTLHAGKYTPNLHGIWDTDIIERMSHGTPQQFADQLEARFGSQMASWQVGSVEDWAWESHLIAEQTAYGKLPKTIAMEARQPPIQTCTENNNIGQRMRKLREVAKQPYQEAAAPVIEAQLAKAAARLAMVLNHVWP